MVLKMAAVRHLGFVKFENFLTVRAVKHTKFRKNRSNRWGDIVIFVIFQMAAAAISLYQISSKSGKPLQRYGDLTFFSKWRPSAILDFLGAYRDHPRRPLDGLYRCAKFGRNRCSSFDNMKLSLFCPFGLKTPIHAPKIGGFGGISPPKMGSNVNETPKRHILARIRVVWAIKRENPSAGLTCRWVHEKKV